MKFKVICERTKEERDNNVDLSMISLRYMTTDYREHTTQDIELLYCIPPTTYRYKTLFELVSEFGEEVKINHTGLAGVISIRACNLNAQLLGAKCDYFPSADRECEQWGKIFIKEEE